MRMPDPTPIYRLTHVDNLPTLLQRGGLHAPRHTPDDDLPYKTIHNQDLQANRRVTRIPCGPGGVIHDYVPFYFGPRSPMLYRIHTRWRVDYLEGQEPLVYLVSTAQAVAENGTPFVFSDGHGLLPITHWFDKLSDLGKVDWETVYAEIWKDTPNDMDRERRKQAEFLVHRFCKWALVQEIGVFSAEMKRRVADTLDKFPDLPCPHITVRRDWYY